MSDAEVLLLVEARKKSGGVAALLNLFIPGAGYCYCNNWILGILVFVTVVVASILTLGWAYFGFVLLLIIDGFLCAKRYNKKLIERVIKERAEIQRKASAKSQRSTDRSPQTVGVS